MSRGAQVGLFMVLVFALAFAGAKLRYRGKATTVLPSDRCDAGLRSRVYEADRLRVINECAAVEGTVLSVHKAGDGDLHIALDPDQKAVLNLLNVFHARRTLVVEAVCDHTGNRQEEIAACSGYQSRVEAPVPGSRVRVIGAYVTDIDNGWNEIHPVSRIEVLR